MLISTGRCETCRYFNALRTQCRRHAPTAFVIPGNSGQPITLGTWPPTESSGWCGEYNGAVQTLPTELAATGPAALDIGV